MVAMDSVFTKFLKHYLGIPYSSNNSITHFITGTEPLSIILQNMYLQSFNSLSFPSCLDGYKLTQSTEVLQPYDPIPNIPTYFWHSKYPGHLPMYSHSRKLLCKDIYDMYHCEFCTNNTFHLHPNNECICVNCGDIVSFYHVYFCSSWPTNHIWQITVAKTKYIHTYIHISDLNDIFRGLISLWEVSRTTISSSLCCLFAEF